MFKTARRLERFAKKVSYFGTVATPSRVTELMRFTLKCILSAEEMHRFQLERLYVEQVEAIRVRARETDEEILLFVRQDPNGLLRHFTGTINEFMCVNNSQDPTQTFGFDRVYSSIDGWLSTVH